MYEMDKFLESNSLLKLNHEESENLTRQSTTSKTEPVIKKTPNNNKKILDQMASQMTFTKKKFNSCPP